MNHVYVFNMFLKYHRSDVRKEIKIKYVLRKSLRVSTRGSKAEGLESTPQNTGLDTLTV